MSAQRPPKRVNPKEMCYQCENWDPCKLDWGECFWVAEAVPGDEYRLLYAYEGCIFIKSKFKPRRAGA